MEYRETTRYIWLVHSSVELVSALDLTTFYRLQNTQSGSQWDGLRHYGVIEHGVLYNNTVAASLPDGRIPVPDPNIIEPSHAKLGMQSTSDLSSALNPVVGFWSNAASRTWCERPHSINCDGAYICISINCQMGAHSRIFIGAAHGTASDPNPSSRALMDP
jgi:hypothetical protein